MLIPRHKSSNMSTQRKLVTLRKITHLRRLKDPRYKAYSLATVGGSWTVVVYHNDFKVGDLVLYFEIDSFIPAASCCFSWQDASCLTEFQGQRGYHVASQMLSKQLSQGLVQPITALPQVEAVLDRLETQHGSRDEAVRIAQGMSFEDILGVKKWEVPFASKGQILGRAPKFFPRPACERAQNIPDLFSGRKKHLHTTFQITEKLDGVSMTVYRVAVGSRWHQALSALPEGSGQESGGGGVRMGVASAAEDLDERGDDVYWRAAKRVGLPGKLGDIGLGNVAVQGELIGPSVKNNSLGFEENAEHEFIVFQIFDIDKQTYLISTEVVEVCKRLGLPHVPVMAYSTLKDFATSLPELLAKAEGVSMRGTTREGFVFKSMREEDFAFKIISNKWLLEQGE